jgi:8-oxo-dGTP pyrophosphatase MutT (NUDIX family)
MIKQIEVVCSAIIENSKKEILLVKSPKWGDKWVMPGGHIEFGETIEEAAKREAMEEVGLKNLKSCGIVSFGEMIASKEFYRPAHLIYFDVLFKTKSSEIKLDNEELSEYTWIKPRKALKLNLAIGYDKVIRDYLNY